MGCQWVGFIWAPYPSPDLWFLLWREVLPEMNFLFFFFFCPWSSFLIIIFYFNTFLILFYFFFLFFYFSPFYSEPCGWQGLGAPAGCQACASEVAEPSSGHWSTRDLSAPCNKKQWKSPKDLHLNAKTQLHSTTSKLQCWTPHAKQQARQEHSPTH